MRLCLPYSMGLTRVFQAFGVSLEGEAFKKSLYTNTYDDQSLHRMGYQKTGGRWVHRGSRQEVEPDSKDDIQDAKAGPSELVDDGTGEAERSKPDTPLVTPTFIEIVDQPSPWTPNAPPPRTQIDGDMEERISP